LERLLWPFSDPQRRGGPVRLGLAIQLSGQIWNAAPVLNGSAKQLTA